MAIFNGFLRRVLFSKFGTFYVVAAVLVGAFTNEYVNDALVLQEGGVPRYKAIRRKSADELVLRGGGRVLVHAGFKDGFFGSGAQLSPVALGDNFTIEVIGAPREHQPDYAHILSNHPGLNDFEGVAIRHDATDTGSFHFMYGNGKAWLQSTSFLLPPETQFYLVVVAQRSRISVFKNGALLFSQDLADAMKSSGMPFLVGNWANKDHGFNGTIDEVRVTEGTLSPQSIRQNAQRLGLAFQNERGTSRPM